LEILRTPGALLFKRGRFEQKAAKIAKGISEKQLSLFAIFVSFCEKTTPQPGPSQWFSGIERHLPPIIRAKDGPHFPLFDKLCKTADRL